MGKWKKRWVASWEFYVFLIIPLAYLLVFVYIPMAGVQIAFKRFTPTGGIWGSEWVGLKNFVKFFQSYQFKRILPNTLRLSLYSLAAGFPIPVIFALLLNVMGNGRTKKIIQTVTYMPHFISTVVLVGMIIRICSPVNGLYAHIIRFFDLKNTDILARPDVFPHLYVWSGIWQNFGWSSIIYLAALAGVSGELHEAAEIDGANRFQRVIHIDFPAILPTATIMLILGCGSIMGIGFEKVYLMQNDMNLRTSEVISTYVYKIGLGSGGLSDFSYATAIGLFNSVVNLVMVGGVNAMTKRMSDTSLW
ncbi:MAG: ABC transporter permease subunit [Treponema sp.]|jgi:putative aldouronate transport system permease protein|nr:ABC transporter permease subunit [Treponema sp.]